MQVLKQGYQWDSKGRLVKDDGSLVVKNAKKLNTPRYFSINFQSIYSGNMHHATRAKIVKWFHGYWKLELEKEGGFEKIVLRGDQVIIPEFFYYDLSVNIRPDFIDNFCFLYKKTLKNTIVELGYLQDDNTSYVRGCKDMFYEVDTTEERRLEFSYKIVNKKTLD